MTQAFHPPTRTLMGPGPSDVPPQILEALARPTIGHLDPQFVVLMDELNVYYNMFFKPRTSLLCQSLHPDRPAWKPRLST